jgi:hypothetical protein
MNKTINTELKAIKLGIITLMMNNEQNLLKKAQRLAKANLEKHGEIGEIVENGTNKFKEEAKKGNKLSYSTPLPSQGPRGLGDSKAESENLSTSGSLSSLEDSLEAQKRAVEAQTKQTELKLRGAYRKLLVDLQKRIPSISDNTYAHATLLFKRVMDVLYSSKYNSQILPSKLPEYLPQIEGLHLLEPLRIFKACIFLSYKIIEDEFMLFLSDFCKVSKENDKVIAKLETLVMIDILDFDLKEFKFEAIQEEKRILGLIGLDATTKPRSDSA